MGGGSLAVLGEVGFPLHLAHSDVVTDTKDTSAVSVEDAVFLAGSGEGPVVASSVTSHSVSEVIVTAPLGLLTIGLVKSPGGVLEPLAVGEDAVTVVVGLQCIGSSVAIVLALDVLALLLEEVTVVLVINEDGNVLPHGGMPVGIVVAFLTALEAVALAVVVLASGHGPLAIIDLLLTNEEALVTVTVTALPVDPVGLLHAELVLGLVGGNVVVVVGFVGWVGASGDGVGGQAITDDLVASVRRRLWKFK